MSTHVSLLQVGRDSIKRERALKLEILVERPQKEKLVNTSDEQFSRDFGEIGE